MVPTKQEPLPLTPSSRSDSVDDAGSADTTGDGVQGEGNYKAAREFNEAERKFVVSGKVADAARAAAPKTDAEQREMIAAEEKGKRRAKDEGPTLTKAWPDPVTTPLPRKE
jgi:hypothetical protein